MWILFYTEKICIDINIGTYQRLVNMDKCKLSLYIVLFTSQYFYIFSAHLRKTHPLLSVWKEYTFLRHFFAIFRIIIRIAQNHIIYLLGWNSQYLFYKINLFQKSSTIRMWPYDMLRYVLLRFSYVMELEWK